MVFNAISQADNAAPPTLPHKNMLQNKSLLERLHHRKGLPPGIGMGMAMPGFQSNVSHPNNSASPSLGRAPVVTDKDNTPYASIVTRNVFGLNPIPVQDPNEQIDNGPPPPKITLTGITTIFGPAEALYKVSGVIKDGKAQDESYILQQGEKQDDIEVSFIDTQKDIVTFNNHGQSQVIPLANGVATGGDTGGGGAASPPNGFPRRFGGNFGGFPRPGGLQQRFGNGNGNNSGANNFSPAGQSSYNGGYSGGNTANDTSSQLSPEDAEALIAAEHAQAVQDNKSYAPIFPRTKFDQEAGIPPSPGGSAPSDSSINP
jgi:hypothetical protein